MWRHVTANFVPIATGGGVGLKQYFQNYEMVLELISSLNYASYILVSPEESNRRKETYAN
jgi:hypothetical protein